jgi:phosphopantothenoylcysteine decarboxylase/phosphopantothenate--cysteine ligase
LIVGFAAETSDVLENARAKRQAKGLDLLVVNDVSAPGAGFEASTNVVTLLDRSEREEAVSLRSKEAIAEVILDRVIALLSQGAS